MHRLCAFERSLPRVVCPEAYLFGANVYRDRRRERGWALALNAELVEMKRTRSWERRFKYVKLEPLILMIGGFCPVACDGCDYIGRYVSKFYVGVPTIFEKPWEYKGPTEKDLCRRCIALRVWEKSRVDDIEKSKTLINKIRKELSHVCNRDYQNDCRNQDNRPVEAVPC